MSTNSGLSDSCRDYVGRNLIIRFVGGWGWTINTPNDCLPYDDQEAVSLTSAEVVPISFISHESASTRGFSGTIVGPNHLLHDMPVLAITMSDGFDYDFTTNICRAWRFWLGHGDIVCPPDSFPRLRGSHIIGGYGSVEATQAKSKCA